MAFVTQKKFKSTQNYTELHLLCIILGSTQIPGRAFDDCSETQSTFKLLHVFGSLTERKLISAQLSDKMPQLIDNLIGEIEEAKKIFMNQKKRIELTGKAQTDRNMPQVSSSFIMNSKNEKIFILELRVHILQIFNLFKYNY